MRNGDRISVDVAARSLELQVDPAELARRPVPSGYAIPASGWLGMYRREVQPMSTGAVVGSVEPREVPEVR